MSDKLDLQSPNLVNQNIEKIAALFPNCVTETADGTAIDFDLLRQELSAEIIDGSKERYRLEWPGKREAIVTANLPTTNTLRPVPDESVDFENTENLYIEGDNLEVLKLLQESYLGKIKMIYIDPPYNTGNDFVYKDNFAQDSEQWLVDSGQKDEYGTRMVANPETSGRYHSDWLTMMYPRLKLARNLLTDDGVIFISIDDNEVHNLRKLCDEVFGEVNFVAQLIWERAFSPKNDAKFVSNSHDYILTFSKSIENFKIGRLPRTEEANSRYSNPDNDPRGVWMSSDISVKTYNEACDYPITTPSGRIVEPPAARCWRLSKNAFLERLQDNRIWFGPDGNGTPRIKRFLSELRFEGMVPTSILFHKDVGHSQEGAKEVVSLFEEKGSFDGPKPVRLLKRLLTIANLETDSIILDFFSGSATTAHAVMQLNAEDGGNRKFIMVQLPEKTDEKSEAYKAGYHNICEIGKERIRRAGQKVLSDQLAVISNDKKIKNGNKELSGVDSLAKGNGAYQIGLFDSEKATKGGDVRPVGSNEEGSGINPIEHSRGAGEELNKGISAISGNSQGVESGTGNPTSSMREGGISCRNANIGSNEPVAGNKQNDSSPYQNPYPSPLTTIHYPLTTDIGFRVYRLDTSNMHDVYYRPHDYAQDGLDLFADNIKPDRTPHDLLAQVMLDWGLPLSYKIEELQIAGKQVFRVAQNSLMACFDNGIDEAFAKELATYAPLRVVFRDRSFATDTAKENVKQLLKQLSAETEMRVI